MSNDQVINGKAEILSDGSPMAILQNFYRAFNNGNIELMTTNWLQSDAISMSNPLGGVRRGWCEIEPVYRRIFEGEAEVYVEFYDYSIEQTDSVFCAVGRERGYFKHSGKKLDLAIRTTRIYQKHNGFWQQLHHHGSIEDPALLKTYQETVVPSPA